MEEGHEANVQVQSTPGRVDLTEVVEAQPPSGSGSRRFPTGGPTNPVAVVRSWPWPASSQPIARASAPGWRLPAR